MSLLQDGIKLARLKRSIGKDHADKRPFTPIEVGKYLEDMMDELDDPSGKIVAERLGISTSLIKDFHGILNSPDNLHYVWGWAGQEGRIAWSQGREACKFVTDGIISEKELVSLVASVSNGEIKSSDMREIVMLKKRNPDKSFEECCKEISNLVPNVINTIIFITDLEPIVIENIDKRASRDSVSSNDLAESVLIKYLGHENMEGVLIKNQSYIKIAITEHGRQKITSFATKEKMTINKIINHLFIKEGFGHEQ